MGAPDESGGDHVAHEILDHLLEGCQLIDSDFRYLYVNDVVARQARTTRQALLGRTMLEVFPGIESTPMFALLQRCMQERVAQRMENQFVFPDGSKACFELRFAPAPHGVLVLSIEITERKRAEQLRRRSRSALTTLGECNHALTRANDEQLFMQQVCEIAVERGGYRMAWIASRAREGSSAVRRIVASGVDAGYTDSLQLGGAEAATSHEPMVDAIRTGQRVVVRAGVDGTQIESWREAAAVRGYGCALALPFQLGDGTPAALGVHCAEPDALDDEEVALLQRLAHDVERGLQLLAERRLARRDAEALRASNERFYAFMQASPALCWVKDEAGRHLYVNGAWERAFDLAHEEWKGKTVFDLLPPDVAAPLHRNDLEVLRTGQPHEVIEDAGELGGRHHHWSTVKFPFRSASGERLIGGIGVDITERLHAEEDIQRLNAQLQRLARAVQDLSRTRDQRSIIEIVCRAARELVNADGATFVLREGEQCRCVGENAIAPLGSGRSVPSSASLSGCVMSQRQAIAIEDVDADARVPYHADRQVFARSLAMVPIQREAPLGTIGVYWAQRYRASADDLNILQALADSTSIAMESVRSLIALQASEDRYRNLVESVEDVVFSLDAAGSFLYVSPSIGRYGYTPEDVIGRAFASFVHAQDLEELNAGLERALAGFVETRVFRARDSRGKYHFMRTTVRAVTSGEHSVGISGVLIDITELKRTEEQLRLAQKMEAVGQLAGGIAHDFNNLLSVILCYANFVAEAVRGDGQRSADVDEIRKAGTRAAELTRQLLAFSRKQELEPRVLDLNQLAANMEKMLRRMIGEDIELGQVLAADLGRVKADPGQLEQVIMNLVVNARDAMPHGGKLTVETANVDIDAEQLAAHATLKAGPFVMLAVTDSGCGMDEATQQRLFEPFFTTKEVGKGTGLGLSTVYGIVEQSGGSIWVYSELGVGTTFKIYLPRVDEALAPPVRSRAPGPRPVGNETILLVEDDESVRSLATRILRAAGYHVLEAANGGAALRLCREHAQQIHLLVTDVVMPQMSGCELAQNLRALRPGLRVLYMSGYSDHAIEHHRLLTPGAMFIGKPFGSTELGRKVREALDTEAPGAAQEEGTPSPAETPSTESNPSSHVAPGRP